MTRVFILLMLTGCASDYWHRDMTYFPAHVEIHQVADPRIQCAAPSANWGCAIRLRNGVRGPTALVYIRADLPQETKECVLQHEFKHALGYGHKGSWTGDCGNGERQ